MRNLHHDLVGCDEVIQCSSKAQLLTYINHLSTCLAHVGAHRFIVIGDLLQIGVSETGNDCVDSLERIAW